MEKGKVSKAQRRATKNREESNPERKRYLRYRSNARTFARHWATEEDIEELVTIFKTENKNQ